MATHPIYSAGSRHPANRDSGWMDVSPWLLRRGVLAGGRRADGLMPARWAAHRLRPGAGRPGRRFPVRECGDDDRRGGGASRGHGLVPGVFRCRGADGAQLPGAFQPFRGLAAAVWRGPAGHHRTVEPLPGRAAGAGCPGRSCAKRNARRHDFFPTWPFPPWTGNWWSVASFIANPHSARTAR